MNNIHCGNSLVFHCPLASFSLSASVGLSFMMSVKCAFISVLPNFKITFNSALTRAPSSQEDFCCSIIGGMDLLQVGGFLSMLNTFVPCEQGEGEMEGDVGGVRVEVRACSMSVCSGRGGRAGRLLLA